MRSEYNSLISNNTWELDAPPPDIKVLGGKWVYKIKFNADGTVDRYKARWVAKGYLQQEGIDYNEVFAPATKYATFRAFTALAASQGLHLHLLDIRTAFLNGLLEESVWIQQPQGFVQDPTKACHLKKTLYGLKQAPRGWYLRLREALESHGCNPASADLGLYVMRNKDGTVVYLLVYVDDILFASSSLAAIQSLKSALASTFDARDLGEPSQFLFISIQRDSSGIKLSQPRMIDDLLAKFNMTDCKPRTLPIAKGALDVEGTPLDTSKFPYSTLIGSLLYIAMCTRPDIAFAVSTLSRYLSCPTTTHWDVAKGVLRYLAGTKNYSLFYSSDGSSSSSSSLHGYCDADWASDKETRRSTTGFLFKLAGAAIVWSSKLQSTVAQSSAEAEYIAAAAVARDAAWLLQLMRDLDLPTSTVPIGTDNQSSLALLNNV